MQRQKKRSKESFRSCWSYFVTAIFKFLPGIIEATLSHYPRVQIQQREHCSDGDPKSLTQAELLVQLQGCLGLPSRCLHPGRLHGTFPLHEVD